MTEQELLSNFRKAKEKYKDSPETLERLTKMMRAEMVKIQSDGVSTEDVTRYMKTGSVSIEPDSYEAIKSEFNQPMPSQTQESTMVDPSYYEKQIKEQPKTPSKFETEGMRNKALQNLQRKIGKTKIEDVTPENVAKLRARWESTGDRNLLDQLKLAEAVIAVKNAPVTESGELDIKDKFGARALKGAQRDIALENKMGTFAQSAFPELFNVFAEEGGSDDLLRIPSFRQFAAVLEDMGTSLPRVLNAALVSSGEGEFRQKMALLSDEKTASEELATEALNLFNFIPAERIGRLPGWLQKIKTPKSLESVEKLKEVTGKVMDKASDIEKFAYGDPASDIAEAITTRGMPDYIQKYLPEDLSKLSDPSFKRSFVKQAIEDAPSVVQDALFRVSNGNEDDAEILMDAIIGASIGGVIGKYTGQVDDGFRVKDPVKALSKVEPELSPRELADRGIQVSGFQTGNVRKAIDLVEEAAKDKSKELDVLLENFDIDIGDILDFRSKPVAGMAKFETEAARPYAKIVKEMVDVDGKINAKTLRDEISKLGDISFNIKQDPTFKGKAGVDKLWKDLRNRLTDGLPDALGRDVNDLFSEMSQLNNNILTPIKKGKGFEQDINSSVDSILGKLKRVVAKPEAPIGNVLTPIFALSSEARKIVNKKYDNLIASEKSAGKRRVLEKQRRKELEHFDFAGNELRQLRSLTDEYGTKAGLDIYLGGSKRSMVYKTIKALRPLIVAPVKGGAKGAKLNITDVINAGLEFTDEGSGNLPIQDSILPQEESSTNSDTIDRDSVKKLFPKNDNPVALMNNIMRTASEIGMPKELANVWPKQISQESLGSVDASPSSTSATGLGQITKGTWQDVLKLMKKNGYSTKDRKRTNPEDNLLGSGLYLMELYNEFQDVDKALMAYHSGRGAVKVAEKKAERDGGSWIDHIGNASAQTNKGKGRTKIELKNEAEEYLSKIKNR